MNKSVKANNVMTAMIDVHMMHFSTVHPLKNKTKPLKDDYLALLTAVAGSDNDIDPQETKFLKMIAHSLGISDMVISNQFCAKMTATGLANIIRSVKSEKAELALMLDAIILTSVDGNISESESQFLGMLSDCLGVHIENSKNIIKLAKAIILKDVEYLKAYIQGNCPIPLESIHDLYLKPIISIDDLHTMICRINISKTTIVKKNKKKK